MPELLTPVEPTRIQLEGPMTVNNISFLLEQHAPDELVVFDYEPERIRKLASGLIHFDRRLRAIQVGSSPELIFPTRKEFTLFDRLTATENDLVTRAELYELICHNQGNQHTIDVHVSGLRKKLGAANPYIETLRGVGFFANKNFVLPGPDEALSTD